MRQRLLAIGCMLLALAACGSGLRAGYISQQQTVDNITITLERPAQAELLQDTELFINLSDAQGKKLDGATVFFEMSMPAMPMPPQQPVADRVSSGRYHIKDVFTMEGDWKVIVHAKVAGKDYEATFDQPVVLGK